MNNLKNTMTILGAKENVPLAALTSFHIGGPAAFVVEAKDIQTVDRAVQACKDFGWPMAVIGNGSNLLCPDDGFEGVIVKLMKRDFFPEITDHSFTAFAGDSLIQISKYTVKQGFKGFERLAGIPGTIGGAIAMNAGAYGSEIISVLKRVHVLELEGKKEYWINAESGSFGYRKSPFGWPKNIVLEAEFLLEQGDGTEQTVMEDCLARRKEKQPLEFPSAGSVFKRPTGLFAGQLIEESGLKGFRIGGAEVSEKHAGFIVNRGGATEKDVLNLIEHIQRTVKDKFNVMLEREILSLKDIVCTF